MKQIQQNDKPKKEIKKREPFLIALVAILVIKTSIELFIVDIFSALADHIFWISIVLALTIYSFSKKRYVYSSIILVILVVGIINL